VTSASTSIAEALRDASLVEWRSPSGCRRVGGGGGGRETKGGEGGGEGREMMGVDEMDGKCEGDNVGDEIEGFLLVANSVIDLLLIALPVATIRSFVTTDTDLRKRVDTSGWGRDSEVK